MLSGRDILANRYSEMKRKRVDQLVSLPHPMPLKSDSNDLIYWPLKEKGFVHLVGKLNKRDNCVDILDEASIQCIYSMGFYGRGSLSRNAPAYHDTYVRRTQTRSKHTVKNDLHHIHAVFDFVPNIQQLIDDLYGSDSNANPTEMSLTSSMQWDTSSNESWVSTSDCSTDSNMSDLTVESVEFPNEASSYLINAPVNDNADESEKLQLGFEEAYFLSYSLGILNVIDSELDEKYLNLMEMWTKYCNLHDANDTTRFAALYGVYHYYRSKGWVVKSGVKFCCDLVLYKEGPPFSHSLFSVIIVRQTSKGTHPTLNWLDLSSMYRVSRGVFKEVLLCYVIIPDSVESMDFLSPKVIKMLKIQTDGLQINNAMQEFAKKIVNNFC